MLVQPTSLADHLASLRADTQAHLAESWLPEVLQAMIVACLARLLGRLEDLVRLWQSGQLTLPPPRIAPPRTSPPRIHAASATHPARQTPGSAGWPAPAVLPAPACPVASARPSAQVVPVAPRGFGPSPRRAPRPVNPALHIPHAGAAEPGPLPTRHPNPCAPNTCDMTRARPPPILFEARMPARERTPKMLRYRN